jgi:hypothetical protein
MKHLQSDYESTYVHRSSAFGNLLYAGKHFDIDRHNYSCCMYRNQQDSCQTGSLEAGVSADRRNSLMDLLNPTRTFPR